MWEDKSAVLTHDSSRNELAESYYYLYQKYYFFISYFLNLMQHCRSNLRKTGVVTTVAVVGGAVVGAFGSALCGVTGQYMPLRNLKSSMAMSPVKLVPLTPSAIICYMYIN